MFGIKNIITKTTHLLPEILHSQTRNTFVVKRKWPPPLHKKGGRMTSKLRGRHFVYDLVQDTNVAPKNDIQVIMKEYVEGIGDVGQVLTWPPFKAYRDLLVPGFAVYATPENLKKYKFDETNPKVEQKFSSLYAQRTINCLSKMTLEIIMSKTQPWSLEPWHIRASFRKAYFVVPEHAITMPPVTIKGPDLSLQEKEFYITVTINQKEKVNVRCRIHHWATGLERLPWEERHWSKPREPLLPEQAEVLDAMPLPK